MGFFENMFGGDPKTESSSSQRVYLPPDMDKAFKTTTQRVMEAGQMPFVPYTDQRIAEFVPDELRVQERIRGLEERYDPYIQGGLGAVGALQQWGTQGPDQALIEGHLNPFRTNVLDVQQRRSMEDFARQRRDLASRAGQVGSFGGSRFGLEEAQLYDDYRQRQDEMEANLLMAGYDRASAAAERGLTRAADPSALMGFQGTELQGIGALQQSGAQQRMLEQAKLDFNFQEFMREQADPMLKAGFLAQNIQPLANTVRGMDTTSTQTYDDGSGWLQKGLGTVASIAGMAMGGPMGAALGGSMMGLGSSMGGSMLGGSLFGAGTGMSAGLSAGQIGRMAIGGASGMYGPGFNEGGLVGYQMGGQVNPYEMYLNAAGMGPGMSDVGGLGSVDAYSPMEFEQMQSLMQAAKEEKWEDIADKLGGEEEEEKEKVDDELEKKYKDDLETQKGIAALASLLSGDTGGIQYRNSGGIVKGYQQGGQIDYDAAKKAVMEEYDISPLEAFARSAGQTAKDAGSWVWDNKMEAAGLGLMLLDPTKGALRSAAGLMKGGKGLSGLAGLGKKALSTPGGRMATGAGIMMADSAAEAGGDFLDNMARGFAGVKEYTPTTGGEQAQTQQAQATKQQGVAGAGRARADESFQSFRNRTLGAGDLVPSTATPANSAKAADEEAKINRAGLLAFGAALVNTPGGFFKAFPNAAKAYGDAMTGVETANFDKQMKLAELDLAQEQKQINWMQQALMHEQLKQTYELEQQKMYTNLMISFNKLKESGLTQEDIFKEVSKLKQSNPYMSQAELSQALNDISGAAGYGSLGGAREGYTYKGTV
jgi:hypothetical protein